jgi:DNA-binding MarR family transcriptional regulator
VEDETDRVVAEWTRVRPDLNVSPAHILQRIQRASLLLAASVTGLFGRYDLTWGEYLVVAALRRAGPPYRMNPTTLFHSIILSSGAMTNRIDRLQEMGLVRRRPDPNDRRGLLVELTTKGRVLVDEVVVVFLANEERLLSGLSAADRKRLADLLRRLLLSEPFRTLDPTSPAPATKRTARSVRDARGAGRSRRGRVSATR